MRPVEKSCGAVIFKKNGSPLYLLLHYKGGHWDFAKGHVRRNESEKETVAREIREEVGITSVRFVEGYRERISYSYKRSGRSVDKEVVFYLVEVKTDRVSLSPEHTEFDWENYGTALSLLTYENAREVLRKANELLENLTSSTK